MQSYSIRGKVFHFDFSRKNSSTGSSMSAISAIHTPTPTLSLSLPPSLFHSPTLFFSPYLPPSIPLVPSLALLLLEATHFPPPRTPSFRGLPQSRRFRRRRQDEQGGAYHVANFGRHRDKL